MKSKFLLLVLLSSFMFSKPSLAQKGNKKIILSGYVTDIKGNPVPGAMILIDKKNSDIVTDSNGFYKVKIRPDAARVTAFTFKSGTGESMIEGRTTVNISISGEQPLNQETNADVKNLNIGYGSVNKNLNTTQINKLDGSQKDYRSYTNVYDMIRGTVPGVSVSGKNIVIQGISSAATSSQPLFVVNGIAVTSIDDIQPSDVKSIEVLKGAAASIYGSRGQNGVLLISLKGLPDRK